MLTLGHGSLVVTGYAVPDGRSVVCDTLPAAEIMPDNEESYGSVFLSAYVGKRT